MDRQIVYPGALARSLDFAQSQQSAMIALGWLGQAILGTAPVTAGLAATPTTPASMSLVIGPGMASSYTTVEASPFGSSLPADTVDPLLKFGINITPTTLSYVAPSTPGQSQNYLIYAEFEEADASPIVLPFVDEANPSAQWSGQGNDGAPLNTQRLQSIVVSSVPGAPANVGSQTTPAAPAGALPLYVLTLTYGQTSIRAANIVIAPGNPAIPCVLPLIPVYYQAKLGYTPANAAGDTVTTGLTFQGQAPVVTVGTGGSGSLVAAGATLGTAASPGALTVTGTTALAGSVAVTGPTALTGPLTVAGPATVNGSAVLIGTTTLQGLGVVSNANANLEDANGNATLQLVGSTGGDVAIGFNSSKVYGLKLGITGSAYGSGEGTFFIGGWSDGSTYRMMLDTSGNGTFRGGLFAASLTVSGSVVAAQGINGSTLQASNGLYTLSAGNRAVNFQNGSGTIVGSIIHAAATGQLLFSANSGNVNAVSIDSAGDVNSPGNLVAVGQVQGAGGIFTGGSATFGGAAGTAGQLSYDAVHGHMAMYSATGAISIDANGNAYTSKGPLATGDTSTSGSNLAIGQILTSTTSARALKENVEPHEDALATLRALTVKGFNYTAESGLDTTEHHVGFIAEDVAEHMPRAYADVFGRPSVKLHVAVPHLWRAVQQLLDRVEVLEARLAVEPHGQA